MISRVLTVAARINKAFAQARCKPIHGRSRSTSCLPGPAKTLCRFALFLVSVLGVTGGAYAKNADDGVETIVLAESQPALSTQDTSRAAELDPLVVTGTRTQHRLSDSPVPVTVITTADIDRSGAVDLAELLQREGGVYVSQAAGRGSTIEIQGLSSEHVLILVDGRRMNGRINGAVDLSRLRVAQIQRVEIVRGPSSALYGADALGGVVNIITRRSAADQAVIQLRGQGDGRIDTQARGALNWDSWSLQSDAVFSRSPAFDLDASRAGEDGAKRTIGAAGVRAQRDFFDAGPLQSIGLDWGWSQEDSEREDAGTGGARYITQKRIEELRLGLAPELAWGDDTLRLDGYYHRYDDQYLQTDSSGEPASDEETLDELLGLGLQWDRQIAAHALTVGLDYQFERLQADRLASRAERDREALYVQDQWRHGGLTLVPGLRFDRDSQFGQQFSPKLALRWDISSRWMLRAGYGHGYRAPDFKQLWLRFDNGAVGYRVQGNPDLQPESSRGLNVSTTWFASAKSSVHLALFANHVKDLIELQQQPDQSTIVYSYANVRSARLYGADVQLQSQLRPVLWLPLQLKLGYGYLHSRDEDSDEPLSGRPTHRVNTAVYLDKTSWAVGLRGVWVGQRQFAVDTSSGGQPTEAGQADAYALMDLRGEWRAWQSRWGLSLAMGMKNIFDVGDARFLPIAPRTSYFEIQRTF